MQLRRTFSSRAALWTSRSPRSSVTLFWLQRPSCRQQPSPTAQLLGLGSKRRTRMIGTFAPIPLAKLTFLNVVQGAKRLFQACCCPNFQSMVAFHRNRSPKPLKILIFPNLRTIPPNKAHSPKTCHKFAEYPNQFLLMRDAPLQRLLPESQKP